MFKKSFIELLRRVGILEFYPHDPTRFGAGSIGDKATFKPFPWLDFYFMKKRIITDRQGGLHLYPVFVIGDIHAQGKSSDLMRCLGHTNTGEKENSHAKPKKEIF